MNAHLTESQLFALLGSPGTLSQSASSSPAGSDAAHLANCALCSAEFTVLRDSLSNFRVAATNLSALYTPTRLLDPATARPRFFTVPRAAWATGLVAAMALCTASINLLHKPVVHPTPATQAETATALESDDALLEGINSDLSTSVAPSLQPLDVPATTETTSATRNK